MYTQVNNRFHALKPVTRVRPYIQQKNNWILNYFPLTTTPHAQGAGRYKVGLHHLLQLLP